MARIIQHEENGAIVFFSIDENAKHIAADGIGPCMIGPANTKVTFIQQAITQPGDSQIKEVVATINIPTAVLLDLARTITETFKDQPGLIDLPASQLKSHL